MGSQWKHYCYIIVKNVEENKSLSFLPPWEFQNSLSLGTPRLLINLPRKWLSHPQSPGSSKKKSLIPRTRKISNHGKRDLHRHQCWDDSDDKIRWQIFVVNNHQIYFMRKHKHFWGKGKRKSMQKIQLWEQSGASLIARSVKNPPAMQESACNARDPGSIPGSGRSPGEGSGSPLQCSCLENPVDTGAWRLQTTGVPRVGHGA